MKDLLKNNWRNLLEDEFEKDYFKDLQTELSREYEEVKVFPAREDLFNALNYTDYQDVKAVIFGQDPYHGEGQAYGLAFSVKDGVKIPPSLRNIYKELEDDLGFKQANHGELTKWADEGVLLLNTVLTVREGQANSHKSLGWEKFTDRIIELLNDREEGIVFILWGNHAIKKEKLIDNPAHHIIKSVHPSPLSAYRGFFGSKPFSKTNSILRELGQGEIDWEIQDK